MPKVKFVLKSQVSYGQAIYIITDQMGWQLSQALRLENKHYKRWEITLNLNAIQLQYKYIVADYDQLENSYYNWEHGENRKVQLKKYQSQVTLVDKLNTRSIDLALFGNQCFDLVLVFGNCKDLILPRAMKLQKINKINFLYYVRFYLELNELNSKIELIYDIVFEDQDYLSNKFQIDCSPHKLGNEVISLSFANLKFNKI